MHIARRFLDQASEELEKQPPDRDKATENAWMAMVHAVKVVAKDRRWRHDREILYIFAMDQIIAEQVAGDDVLAMHSYFGVVEGMNSHYFGNFYSVKTIRAGIMAAQRIVTWLDETRHNGPKPTSVDDDECQRRLAVLLGIDHLGQDVIDEVIPIGMTSDDGFKKDGRLGRAVSRARSGKAISTKLPQRRNGNARPEGNER